MSAFSFFSASYFFFRSLLFFNFTYRHKLQYQAYLRILFVSDFRPLFRLSLLFFFVLKSQPFLFFPLRFFCFLFFIHISFVTLHEVCNHLCFPFLFCFLCFKIWLWFLNYFRLKPSLWKIKNSLLW